MNAVRPVTSLPVYGVRTQKCSKFSAGSIGPVNWQSEQMNVFGHDTTHATLPHHPRYKRHSYSSYGSNYRELP
jgi:hypothetical protein